MNTYNEKEIIALLQLSLIHILKPIRDYDVFVGKTMEFKVVKINQEFKNVVVSHKALIEAELEQQKKEIDVYKRQVVWFGGCLKPMDSFNHKKKLIIII